ncbi:unnamed protein product [Leptidea sinapis]|uniref:Uncharacterized protein n=1 Tax=Leptidea sinapis TaxID=189913 RepID=A0A5E4Q7W2_9NEOP|nr:unnamed protein product [Leptidea sinapis]
MSTVKLLGSLNFSTYNKQLFRTSFQHRALYSVKIPPQSVAITIYFNIKYTGASHLWRYGKTTGTGIGNR